MAVCEKRSNAIALFDSGVGGVTILKEIVSLLPYEEVIYYADSANCPYGDKSSDEITALSEQAVEVLLSYGVKLIVVACNTATTNSIVSLRNKYPNIEFVGIEPAVRPAIELTRSGVVGVIATRPTITSNQVGRLSDMYGSGQLVYEVAGDGLVEHIEEGSENSEECETLLRGYIQPLLDKGIDCLALGCTHYPFLIDSIKRIIGQRDIKIINPAGAIARRVKSLLEQRDLLNESGGGVRFLSSGGGEEYIDILKNRFDMHKIR